MDIAIVGHGPSMLANTYGNRIDAHDFVVRLKRSRETLNFPQHFGHFTEAVCGSWTIRNTLADDGPTARQQWVFVDSRHEDVTERMVDAWVGGAAPGTVRVCSPSLCRVWDDQYRSLRTDMPQMHQLQEHKETSDALGHTHMSAGLHALLYAAADIIGTERVTLFGFDNVKSGRFTWSVTRGPEWDKYPDHRWDVEHQMVPLIAEDYGVEVVYA